jgi:hypothetical protein
MAGNSAYQTGDFDYADCWEYGFIAPGTNDEKAMTALTLKSFANSLADQHFLFGEKNEPIHLVEAGIGDGSSTKRFLTALANAHKPGFIIHGSDPNPLSLDVARVNLTSVQGVRTEIGSLMNSDAFNGERLTDTPGHIFLGSHFLYFTKHRHDLESDSRKKDTAINADLTAFLNTAMNSLSDNGMVILYHDGEDSGIYGKDGIGGRYGNSMVDVPERIASLAPDIGFNMAMVKVPARLFFPTLPDATIEAFKYLRNWKNYHSNTIEATWLRKFLFALDEMPTRDSRGRTISLGGAKALNARGMLREAVAGRAKTSQRGALKTSQCCDTSYTSSV